MSTQPKYHTISNFSGGIAMVSLYNKKGFIDKTGKEIVPPKYEAIIEDFNNGLAKWVFNDYEDSFYYIKVFPNGKIIEYYDD